MKKTELEMAQFLEALKAPQSRRILEKLAVENRSLSDLLKATKLSEQSIRLHMQPLIKARLVSKSTTGIFKINWATFNKNSEWFSHISELK